MKEITTNDAPKAIGPYSQGISSSGETIFVSGQIPIDPATGQFAGDDIETQTEQCLKNVGAILKAAGADYSNVTQATVMLSDIKDFEAMNKVYAKFFTGSCPARAAFQVAALPRAAKVEIGVTAMK